jgi:glycosyltransferase involved in cell wall biosynthesis
VNFIFLSTPSFEAWDWTNPDLVGIGGSETSHIEMSNRLSEAGHNVYSYGPTPFEEPRVNPHGVTWERCDHDPKLWDREGVWVIYRDPEMIDGVKPGNPIWLVCQDVDYQHLTIERALRCDRIIALCSDHAAYLKNKYPQAADRMFISSNGIKPEVIESVLADPPVRNPKRLIYASSPDRGLWYLVDVFNRAREIVNDLELHVYYGFDNIEKWLKDPDTDSGYFAIKRRELLAKLKAPGIFWHGRKPQPELAVEWAKSGIWCHPSLFTETSCITCMDAQALGAIPISSPVWAIGENVQHGVLVDGDPQESSLCRSRFVHEVVKLAQDPARQSEIRAEMMPWALDHFNWDRFVDQWEDWATEDLRNRDFSSHMRLVPRVEVAA